MQMNGCEWGLGDMPLWRRRMSSLWKCAAMSQGAKGPQEAGDKGTEGSRVTSCPCADETMPSVNKPKLAVMTEVG